MYKRIGSVAALGRTPIVGVGAESVASSVVAGRTASSVVAGRNGRKARGVVGGGIVAHGVGAATTVPPCLGGQCLGYTISPRCINCTAATRTLVSVIIDVIRQLRPLRIGWNMPACRTDAPSVTAERNTQYMTCARGCLPVGRMERVNRCGPVVQQAVGRRVGRVAVHVVGFLASV